MGRRSVLPVLALLAAPLAAQQPHYLFVGDGGGAFGKSVAAADVNADGVFDVVVGAPWEGCCGRVKVYSGSTGAQLLPALTDGQGATFCGYSVDDVGDVDGDGYDDIAFGAATVPGDSGGPPGAAQVRSGLDGSMLFRVGGSADGDLFGTAVAGLGDIDLDGVPDWAVGAPENFGFNGGPGYVRVFSGADGSTIRTLHPTGTVGDFGRTLLDAGDVDADGVPDLLVGATDYFAQVRMVSGATGDVIWLRYETSFSRMGSSLGRAGDLDADGFPDVLVGDYAVNGRVQAFRADTGDFLFEIRGGHDEGLGDAVVGLGDLDLDGHDDFAVGAKFAAGPSGGASGSVRIYSGRTHLTLWSYHGPAGSFAGNSLAALGDIDQDGETDLAIGAYQHYLGPGMVGVFTEYARTLPPHVRRR